MINKNLVIFGIIMMFLIGSCNDSTGPAENQMRIRKNVKSLTSTEKKDFVDAILKLKNTPSPYNDSLSWYDQFVYWHRDAYVCDETNPTHGHSLYPAHMSPGFLPWHRAFLLEFENALSEVSGKNIALPYWDWTDEVSTSAVFSDDMMGGSGDPDDNYALKSGPFKKGDWTLEIMEDLNDDPFQWKHIVRALGKNPPRAQLPTKSHIAEMLEIPNYDHAPYSPMVNHNISFRNYLEGYRGSKLIPCNDSDMDVTDDDWTDSLDSDGIQSAMHNGVHLWVGGVFLIDTVYASGTMTFSVSPNDPVFWLHHANVDRMWTLWMNKHGKNYQPVSGGPANTNLNDFLPPFDALGKSYTPKKLQTSRDYNFYYDVEVFE
jgi:tyrosinase